MIIYTEENATLIIFGINSMNFRNNRADRFVRNILLVKIYGNLNTNLLFYIFVETRSPVSDIFEVLLDILIFAKIINC
jgi:dihydroorotate dehydrogenase